MSACIDRTRVPATEPRAHCVATSLQYFCFLLFYALLAICFIVVSLAYKVCKVTGLGAGNRLYAPVSMGESTILCLVGFL